MYLGSLCTRLCQSLGAAHYLGLFDSALRILSVGSKGFERSNGRAAFSGVVLGAHGVFDTGDASLKTRLFSAFG